MAPPTIANESLAVVAELLNDRTGLWLISDKRKDVIRENVDALSPRAFSAAQEMLAIADLGERFWPTKAEYYVVLSEIKTLSISASKSDIEAVIEEVTNGAMRDRVAHREWVKRALGILAKLSKEK